MVSVPKAVMHPHFKWVLLVLVLVILFLFLFQGGRDDPEPVEPPEPVESEEPAERQSALLPWLPDACIARRA